jgi:hypothetical protein
VSPRLTLYRLKGKKGVRHLDSSYRLKNYAPSIYEDWSLLMRIKLEPRDLRDVVEHGDANRQEDHMALDIIVSVVLLEMIRPTEK